ncbi:60S ribosomal protein L18a-like isoform X1 [Prunus avium]|uniref:60S ribosomal protein L18a-like isoform X1 n=1 Tax=Prunus avium TaxID=42229 RepID=A0A6P5TNK9_PRUAV|nr:60S ribosomal protein L18a-like isoform X1 [Prunus avium]XP_021828587.1 60S ribosomal protein L18a-like isoform X1 [Prunus avium]
MSNGKAAINSVFFVLQFHQYQVVGRKLPMASDEHPKIYRMKLWATNEVRAKSKFWYFLRKLKKVKKSNGQVLALNESMLFCGGEVVPPQLSSWRNPICCQRCEGGCVKGTPSK